MIRSAAFGAALGLALLGAALPVAAAEGGIVRGGEHYGFTRIVLTIEPTTEWSLETAPGRATVHFPGRQLAFDTAAVFDKIPQTRVRAVRSEPAAEGTTITVDLACDCRVSTSFVGARYLALDVADRGAAEPEPPIVPAETPEARAAREKGAVDSAEQALLRQIERAADQGLVVLSQQGPPEGDPTPMAAPPHAAATPAPSAPATRPPQIEVARLVQPDSLAGLDQQDQVEATTVFDRDGRKARSGAAEAAAPDLCLPDDRLDVGAWSNGLPFATQLPILRRQLVGEFDQPSATGLRDLTRLYIRFGFGAEAEALLASFGTAPELEDRALLIDLARAVEGRPATSDGPLSVAEPCPGQHGLWLALGGVAPVVHDAESFAAVQAAFEALPPDLRLLVGPGLAGRLLDAGHPAEARLIFDTTARPGAPADAALALIGARLAAAEGQPVVAVQTLTALIEASGHTSVEALVQLARIALDAGMPVPERVVTDLRAAALLYRGTEREVGLRRLLIASLGRRADLAAALREARAAARDLPAAAPGFEALAVAVLAGADPAEAGAGAYAETVLAAADLVGRTAADDPARTTIARQLIALGLPDPALRMIAPGLAAGAEPARLLAAEARLRLNEPEAARAALGALAGPESAQLRARAFALSGAYDAARTALVRGGLAAEAGTYAWPSGDWARVAAATDPSRLAMASYMTARAGEAAAPAPAADPAKLTPEEAFQEPLPPLDRPSLDAVRRLLSTGGQVGGFVQGVLAGN